MSKGYPEEETLETLFGDGRYSPEAYLFLLEALAYTRKQVSKRRGTPVRHVTGYELLEGFRQLGLERFGLLAKAVFKSWGIHSTSDIGDMVFRLIEAGELEKSERDRRSDFDGVFDFDEALSKGYRIDVSHLLKKKD